MALAPGTRLGPYEVLSALGAGGMGEVYKAADTRLSRTVAIKVLPEHVASDTELKQRFEREAKTLATLSHPHICPVFDVGSQAGSDFLVMEYLEGETLERRLKKGALPLDQALQIGTQIAEALAAAHRAGIVHRDLKPGNIMLTKSGAKLLDFGLAKTSAPAVAGSLSMLPTTPPNLTAQGAILGTFQYMAPEQLEGQEASTRTDIFAFGTVVYEMVTGKKAFEGKNQASLIAAILERDPPAMSSLQSMTPALLDHVVSRCLAKDPDERWQTAADVMQQLKWIVRTGSEASVPARDATRRLMRERLAWVSALTVVTLIAAGIVLWGFPPGPTALPPEMRVEITTPPTPDLVSLAISPDGQKLAYVASADGRPKLWLRSLVTGSARPLVGTDGASFPFWSPDSQSIGFFANSILNRIDIDGGSLRALAFAAVGAGGTWSREGVILFPAVPDAPITRVSADGGVVTLVPGAEPGRVGFGQRFPQFLPDGSHFLYFVAEPPDRGVYVGSLEGAERRRLFDADAAAVFVPPAEVFFIRAGTLFAQRFDPLELQLGGTAVPMVNGVTVDAVGAAAVSGSAVGSLVYRIGAANRQRQFVWFSRSGEALGGAAAPDSATPVNPVLSPDGRIVALNRSVSGNADIWLLELGRGVLSRFTTGPEPHIHPVWAPDGDGLSIPRAPRNAPDSICTKRQ